MQGYAAQAAKMSSIEEKSGHTLNMSIPFLGPNPQILQAQNGG